MGLTGFMGGVLIRPMYEQPQKQKNPPKNAAQGGKGNGHMIIMYLCMCVCVSRYPPFPSSIRIGLGSKFSFDENPDRTLLSWPQVGSWSR